MRLSGKCKVCLTWRQHAVGVAVWQAAAADDHHEKSWLSVPRIDDSCSICVRMVVCMSSFIPWLFNGWGDLIEMILVSTLSCQWQQLLLLRLEHKTTSLSMLFSWWMSSHLAWTCLSFFLCCSHLLLHLTVHCRVVLERQLYPIMLTNHADFHQLTIAMIVWVYLHYKTFEERVTSVIYIWQSCVLLCFVVKMTIIILWTIICCRLC